ncbi:MAG: hypothetical protein ACT4NK_01620 [Limnobacter sp.]|jgi:hypothetical protein|uniref:hypothetical protein n=1 Tax=unclassified Limnobacter TaxID=2630203 RepID=UPI0012E9C312|nr:hypothetical protein [Limnobacter sp. MED105]
MLNEFTFAARVVSASRKPEKLVFNFTSECDSDTYVKFDPRFFLIRAISNGQEHHLVSFYRAWVLPFGIFLFSQQSAFLKARVLFVPASSPAFRKLRVLACRLQSHENAEKPSLSSYFWRMNVLR